MAKVNPIPDGNGEPTPYLAVDGAGKAIDFYKTVFDAREVFRHEHEGRVGHAELRIGSGRIMLADEHAELGFRGPKAYGGSPVMLHLYVENVDDVFRRATASGATVVRPLTDQFYGDRSGQFTDPWGHVWNVSTHVEDVSPEELDRRAKAAQRAKGA